MASLRSQETIQKEYDLQAKLTTQINVTLVDAHPDYRKRLEDHAIFANEVRKVAPEKTMVLLHHRPEVILTAESEDYTVSLVVRDNMWRFYVNESTHYELPAEMTVGAGLLLRKMWNAVIPCLPEGFIIRGKVNPRDPESETVARTKIQQALGFSLPQADDSVFAIKRDGKMVPLGLDEFVTLTGVAPDNLQQKFNVRKIDWQGA
jgi:hypothetical protein